jgi:hypothetical protein
LLLSIADLLKCFDLRHTSLRPTAMTQGQAQINSMFLYYFPREEHGGKPCLLADLVSGPRRLAGSCEYDTVSPGAFQPGT